MEVREKISRAKYVKEEDIANIDEALVELRESINELISKGGILDA